MNGHIMLASLRGICAVRNVHVGLARGCNGKRDASRSGHELTMEVRRLEHDHLASQGLEKEKEGT